MHARQVLWVAGLLGCALTSQVTHAQPKTRAVSVSTHITRWAKWTQRALINARQERDLVRALCLDERLSELHALERTALQNERDLSSRELHRARRARTALQLNYSGARLVYRAARQCRGGGPYYAAGTQVRVWVDPRVAPYEPRTPDTWVTYTRRY